MQKPSPHRFLPAQQVPAAASTASQTPRFRKQENDGRRPDDGQQQPQQANQFAFVPRFSQGPGLRNQSQPRSPPKSSFVQALQLSKRPPEGVEESSDRQEDDEMLGIEQDHPIPTTEEQARDSSLHSFPFSPKRRRLDNDDAYAAGQPPGTHETQRPIPDAFNPAPAFTILRGASAQPKARDDTGPLARPAFIRPTAASEQTHEPLPETFSPHKRGSKFPAGGMASTVQQWVIEAGQAAVNSRKGQSYLHGEDYVKRVKIESVIGSRAYTARATASDNSSINILLAGRGPGDAEILSPKSGSMIGVRAPVWNLEVDGTTWLVAVDWKHLSGG